MGIQSLREGTNPITARRHLISLLKICFILPEVEGSYYYDAIALYAPLSCNFPPESHSAPKKLDTSEQR